jgi:hypothetical protein
LLDDDDLLLPHHLENSLALLESGADMVYSSAPVAGRRSRPGAAVDTVDMVEEYAFRYDADFLDVLNYIPVSTVVCRQLPADARFDTTLRVEEDWEMWLQMVRGHGYQVAHEPRHGAVYHRVSDVESITSLVDDVAVIKLFAENYARITDRWPARAGSRTTAYRSWMLHVYDVLFAQFDKGLSPATHWYERVVRVLADGFNGVITEKEVAERLQVALRPSAVGRS